MDFDRDHDARVRGGAFDWLAGQVSIYEDGLQRALLLRGFDFDGRRVPFLGPQGIFKPAVMEVPLSITTSPNSPYDDTFGDNDILRYRYRGTDPNHRDNVGLRTAMDYGLPLIYFHGVVPGLYVPMWPVHVVRDSVEDLAFSVTLDRAINTGLFPQVEHATGVIAEPRREYATGLVRRRLHQMAFRERVLRAYQSQCALCRLRHRELLDAAHIVPDAEPEGEPVVSNGIALCRLHHAAFDRFFLAVRPDHIIEIRADVLREIDGPTLQHAIQGLHGQRIVLPRRSAERPSEEFLTLRYERFLDAAAAR